MCYYNYNALLIVHSAVSHPKIVLLKGTFMPVTNYIVSHPYERDDVIESLRCFDDPRRRKDITFIAERGGRRREFTGQVCHFQFCAGGLTVIQMVTSIDNLPDPAHANVRVRYMEGEPFAKLMHYS